MYVRHYYGRLEYIKGVYTGRLEYIKGVYTGRLEQIKGVFYCLLYRGVYAGRLEQIKGVYYSLPKFLGSKSTNPREKSTLILCFKFNFY